MSGELILAAINSLFISLYAFTTSSLDLINISFILLILNDSKISEVKELEQNFSSFFSFSFNNSVLIGSLKKTLSSIFLSCQFF
jgi:hypothetical protein